MGRRRTRSCYRRRTLLVTSLTVESRKGTRPAICHRSLKSPKIEGRNFAELLVGRELRETISRERRKTVDLERRGVSTTAQQRRSSSTPITSMFTGIVEEMGRINQLGYDKPDSFTMKIQAKLILEDINLGDSISVNGTCLTVDHYDKEKLEFSVGLAPETLRKTSLIELEQGSLVNLERALKPSSRMGGHFVQGHVDGTGEIVEFKPEGDSLWVKVKTVKEILRYIVPKGYIAVDGTSLTVVDVFDEEDCFNFMLVAYTQQKVVIPMKKVGQKVNLEVDILGKYVERLLSTGFVDAIKSS
ncbi:hypothetical protein CQW23_17432 [Capsicum baccatum]|uniref:Riboflavin synthase n=1 Tax=Capsicum baccatum TaxID=33114 RepID=A0A2G2WDX0_CAPBA|nr:hypothetical protein CQW23_17432 [Capsicum baccatum]